MTVNLIPAAATIGTAGFISAAFAHEMDTDQDGAVGAKELATAIADGRLASME
tara:strand:- start:628 stop:786 length:159 start_codon:yes stop_codon:yes gene_type:complete